MDWIDEQAQRYLRLDPVERRKLLAYIQIPQPPGTVTTTQAAEAAAPITSFSDTFNRDSGPVNPIGTLNWLVQTWTNVVSSGTTTIQEPRIGLITGDGGGQGLIAGPWGPNNPTNNFPATMYPTQLCNPFVSGLSQFSQCRITSEQSTGSFTGPAALSFPGQFGSNGVEIRQYELGVRNSQWSLRRRTSAATVVTLIALTSFTIPATLRLEVRVTSPTQNDLTVYVNGVVVGTSSDTSGVSMTGIPAFWITSSQSGGVVSSTNWRNWTGGIL